MISDYPPGPRGRLFSGVYRDIVKNPFHFLKNNFEEYPGISRFRIVHANIVHVWHPDYIQRVLQERFQYYGLAVDRRAMKLLFREGLLTNDGESWKKQRVLVQPAFQPSSLLRLAEKIETSTAEMIAQWDGFAASGASFDAYPEMKSLVNRIIARTLLSSEMNPGLEELGDSLLHLKEETLNRFYRPTLPTWVPTPGNRHYLKRKKAVDRRLQEVISARRRQTATDRPDDILSALMAAIHPKTGESMSDAQLIDESISIYAAAHEPTATILMYLIFLLGKNPAAAEKIRKEILAHSEAKLDPAQIRRWPYTAAVVQEGLRLYPAVWAFTRQALQDDALGPYRIRRGDNVVFSPYFIHRHPEYWNEPDAFRPERFLDGSKPAHHFAYLPFGAGPKYCVGSEFANLILKIVLGALASRFRFYLEPGFELEIEAVTTLRPKHGLSIQVEAIQEAEKSVGMEPMRST